MLVKGATEVTLEVVNMAASGGSGGGTASAMGTLLSGSCNTILGHISSGL